MFYKTTARPRRPLLSGPESGLLIQVCLYSFTEAYSEPSQTFKVELFAKVVAWLHRFVIFAKSSIPDLFDKILNTLLKPCIFLCALSHNSLVQFLINISLASHILLFLLLFSPIRLWKIGRKIWKTRKIFDILHWKLVRKLVHIFLRLLVHYFSFVPIIQSLFLNLVKSIRRNVLSFS